MTAIRPIAGLAMLLAAAPVVAASAKPTVGQMAPPFTLTLMDGSKVTSEELRGKVVVLNYWATWCGPCRKELPLLDTYYRLQRKAGLRVYAATTENSVPLYQMKKLFAVMEMTPVRKMARPYDDVTALPTNYVIDRSGRIRYAQAGAFDLDTLNAVLVPLLREAPPPGTLPDRP